MMEQLTTPEAVTVLALLMVGADGETKLEELASMLANPFFREHVAEKIGQPMKFIQKYNQTKNAAGADGMEKRAVTALKSSFPAFRIKTVALMTIIAQADDNFDDNEKILVARVSKALSVSMDDVGPEIEKMNEAPPPQTSSKEDEKAPAEQAAPEEKPEAPAEQAAPEEKTETPPEQTEPAEKTES